MKLHQERILSEIAHRKQRFGTVVHERTSARVVKGALVNDRVMEMAVADLPAEVISQITAAKQIEPDVLINREKRRHYICEIVEIAVDGLELGRGEQWTHRDTKQMFYVVDSLRLSTAQTIIMKGLAQFIRVRDGGLKRGFD